MAATLGVERLPATDHQNRPLKHRHAGQIWNSDSGHTDEVEVQHSLRSLWLQSVDESSGLGVEERMLRGGRPWPRGSCETANVVIGGS